jgi:hypothetical protein
MKQAGKTTRAERAQRNVGGGKADDEDDYNRQQWQIW